MLKNNNRLKLIDNAIYKANGLIISEINEEKQNAEYDGYTFKLSNKNSSKHIRFRVAKIKPNKLGQFVSFWEKDSNHVNQPFTIDNTPDLLVISTFSETDKSGQFVFPKYILIKKNIIKSSETKGKMGMRVYPAWDKLTSKAALQSQH